MADHSHEQSAGRAWKVTEAEDAEQPHGVFAELGVATQRYLPLVSTLRLYAGWLLAWYFFLYALAGYQLTRNLPFHWGALDILLSSPALLTVSFAVFLFLMLSSIHGASRGRSLSGILLVFLGCILTVVFWANLR